MDAAAPIEPAKPKRGAKPKGRAARRGQEGASATPMMVQYLAIKRANPDCLLFYRMGDFYELFFDDAVTAAAALDITLTHRGKHDGADIPMCGVPVHAADTYLSRLIRKGFRVAVCEQTEDPAEARKRGNKSVVAREVARIVTPGTITEETLLDARSHNYLAALSDAGGGLGLAWLDASTGEFAAEELEPGALRAALSRIEPGELLLPERLLQRPALFELFNDRKDALTPLPDSRFDSASAARRLETFYGVQALDAFGAFSRAEIAACGALVDYLELTQKGRFPRLARPAHVIKGAMLEIDAATRRNLELVRTLSGARDGSLLAVIDRTITGAGGRLLAARLSAPLTDAAEINRRADGVQFFVERNGLCDTVRAKLAGSPDMARALSRLTLGRGGPRDLAGIRDGLKRAGDIGATLTEAANADVHGPSATPGCIADCVTNFGFHTDLIDRLDRALKPELPVLTRDGGFIADGYIAALDELRTLSKEGKRLIAGLQTRYADETGIASLKIRHNNVLGYFIEVTPVNADKMPAGEAQPFIHRQTLAGAVRYATVELGELETRIGRAADQALALELKLFEDLVGEVVARADPVALAAEALAVLDVTAGLGELAATGRYVRPKVDDSLAFEIAGGRHAVVEAARAADQEAGFVPNDCSLAPDQRLWLVTGPNMAGKSTFLRQNALIAVLAQMGSFVPADAAHIGIIDRLFSRVGAADDLARGRSTFMVEMVETAAILNQAGQRALIILDEIGRGTSTFDGLSIAWATVEHIHEENRCRTLFATHYHELTGLRENLAALKCFNMRVKEWQGEVIFLHEVAPGAAERSYGIHVGRLAGLPAAVLKRAEEVLHKLEKDGHSGRTTSLADELPLFQVPAAADTARQAVPSPAERALAEINADELTPRQALELIYRLKALENEST